MNIEIISLSIVGHKMSRVQRALLSFVLVVLLQSQLGTSMQSKSFLQYNNMQIVTCIKRRESEQYLVHHTRV